MLPLRRDLFEQLMEAVSPTPQITLAMVAEQVRVVLRHDPMKAERAVGQMYGYAFKKREELYDVTEARRRDR
jgi:hypothetical protein